MITLFGSTFSILGFLLLVFCTLFVLSQLSWWLFGKYFPSANLCGIVHKNASAWLLRERKVLKSLEKFTVFGFLSTVLLMAIIPLNVTILAQVFELFVPSGEIITFPFIDSYGTFPLLVGLLFALVEVAFSAVAELKRKLNQKAIFVYVIIGLMIFVEAGLNFYRGWIMEGDDTIMRTFWDKMIGIGGPVLAAFLGVVVPLAMVLLGAYAMVEFIMPVLKNLAVFLRFTVSTAGIYLSILLFGFHNKKPVDVPAPVARLYDQVHNLKSLSQKLHFLMDELKPLYAEFRYQETCHPDKLEQAVFNLEQNLRKLESNPGYFETGNGEVIYSLDNQGPGMVQNKFQLRKAINDTKREIREFRTLIHAGEQDFEGLSQKTIQMKKVTETCRYTLKRYLEKFEKADELKDSLKKTIHQSKIIAFCGSIDSVLRQKSAQESLLSEREIQDLIQMVNPSSHLSKSEREWYQRMARVSRSMVQTAKSELIQIQNILDNATDWLSAHKLTSETSEDQKALESLDQLEKKLIEIDARMKQAESNRNDQFDELQAYLRQMALQVRAIFIWMGLFIPLQKRI